MKFPSFRFLRRNRSDDKESVLLMVKPPRTGS